MLRKRIRTRFKRNESFDYLNVPKHFYSVTDGSIHNVRKFCLKDIANKYGREGYKAVALRDMLGSINGEFNSLYVALEGDYSTRKNNLKMAYSNGLADMYRDILDFETLVDEYKQKYEEYSEALKDAVGRAPSDSLEYDPKQFNHIKAEVSKMQEEQKNEKK